MTPIWGDQLRSLLYCLKQLRFVLPATILMTLQPLQLGQKDESKEAKRLCNSGPRGSESCTDFRFGAKHMGFSGDMSVAQAPSRMVKLSQNSKGEIEYSSSSVVLCVESLRGKTQQTWQELCRK